MFHLVTIRAADAQASEAFYATVLPALGGGFGDFRVAAADSGHPVTRRLHIGFAAPSRSHVDDFWRAGTAAGHRDDGAPGPRPQYRDDYYGGFLLDPDGNSAEAVHHGGMAGTGRIDHLWLRVRDLEAAARFYEELAPRSGFAPAARGHDHAQFRGPGASFMLVPGEPTEGVELAFATDAAPALLLDPEGNRVELAARR
jgi:catechol 2,3-dioxygenase-like lactoylglutathione lyase family enzyme